MLILLRTFEESLVEEMSFGQHTILHYMAITDFQIGVVDHNYLIGSQRDFRRVAWVDCGHWCTVKAIPLTDKIM